MQSPMPHETVVGDIVVERVQFSRRGQVFLIPIVAEQLRYIHHAHVAIGIDSWYLGEHRVSRLARAAPMRGEV